LKQRFEAGKPAPLAEPRWYFNKDWLSALYSLRLRSV